MNTTTNLAPVDVLAVMQDAAEGIRAAVFDGCEYFDQDADAKLEEARAAVAELIEKCRAVTATGDDRTLRIAIDELRAALARCGGAS